MRGFLAVAMPSFLIGAVCGAAVWYLASPLWIDRVVSETLAEARDGAIAATGAFVDTDVVHKGAGQVQIITRADGLLEAQFTRFEVTNGPDLEVWLSAHPNPKTSADVSATDWLSLGRLKGNIGDQAYTIPLGTDFGQYPSIVIWCEQFGVLFSAAVLSRS